MTLVSTARYGADSYLWYLPELEQWVVTSEAATPLVMRHKMSPAANQLLGERRIDAFLADEDGTVVEWTEIGRADSHEGAARDALAGLTRTR